jgi:glycerol-1-phosphate dehydrogenase [NAD(P)+]
VYQGEAPSHGFKVGVATHFIAWIYGQLLREPLDRLDVATACARWRPEPEVDAAARQLFTSEEILALARRERAAKQVAPAALAAELDRLRACWPALRERLRRQLLPSAEIRRRLVAVGAPDRPAAIGLSRERMVASAWRAQQIRRRYTVLDLCLRAGLLERILARYQAHGDE